MKKRDFLNVSALIGAASLSPTPALAAASATGPTLLTVGGLVPQGNRPALDPELDQMMAKHGVRFGQAFTFDAAALQALPKTRIRPTLEYDGKEHTLSGPALLDVLSAAGVKADPGLRLGIRALDGYNVEISVADVAAYRMILVVSDDYFEVCHCLPKIASSIFPRVAMSDGTKPEIIETMNIIALRQAYSVPLITNRASQIDNSSGCASKYGTIAKLKTTVPNKIPTIA